MFMNATCPSCGHRWRVPECTLGQQVKCPACAGLVLSGPASLLSAAGVVPSPAPVTAREVPQARAVSPQTEQTIHYRCARCGKSLESPAHLAGHKVNCPDCGQRLQVPQAAAVPVSPAAPPSAPAPLAEVEPILTVLPASHPAPADPARREYCLECGVDVTERSRVQTCPACGSLFCSARCFREHNYHAHPSRRS